MLESSPQKMVFSPSQSEPGKVRSLLLTLGASIHFLPSFLLPRYPSIFSSSYNDVYDEHRATNLLISADEAFADVHTTHIGVHSDDSPPSFLSLPPSIPLFLSSCPFYSLIVAHPSSPPPLLLLSSSSPLPLLLLSSSSASQQISWILLIQVRPRHKGLGHRGSQVRGEQREDCNMYLHKHLLSLT